MKPARNVSLPDHPDGSTKRPRGSLPALFLALLLLAACTPSTPPATAPPPVTQLPPVTGTVVEHPRLTSFQMLLGGLGWGLTESQVLRTDDGGATWHDATPPGVASLGYNAAASYLSIRHAAVLTPDQNDPMHAGRLYITRDGGATWSASPAPFGNAQIRFFDFDFKEGWAMAGLGVAAGSNAIAIYRTSDGGGSWEKVFTNLPGEPDAREDIPMGGLKGVFYSVGTQKAWVGGVVYSDSTSYLYRTDDGGRHWSQVELPAAGSGPAQWSVESIQFPEDQTGFLAMRISGQAGSLAIYVTHDQGDTWELTPTLLPEGRAADFVSTTEGFVFDGTDFQFTRDAGQTWTAIPPDIVFSESFMHMDFVDALNGWVTALDPTTSAVQLYQTSDGGRTWLPR